MSAQELVVLGRVFKIASSLFLGCVIFAASGARAEDPDFVTLVGGYFDFNRQKDKGFEGRLEYRFSDRYFIFKPFLTAAYTNTKMGFFGAGVLVDIYLGRRFVVIPSFAPTFYFGGNDKLDLGHPIEFRSQLELAYRFDNRSRLGFAVSHYSNASLGDSNPGTETLSLNYSIPVNIFK